MKRPIGITILAILCLFGGVALLAVQAFTWKEMLKGFESIGVSGIAGLLAVVFLAVLGIAAGSGMLLGAKWGWWVGAFYFCYAIARNTSALIMLSHFVEQGDVPPTRTSILYAKYGGRIIVSAAMVLYFFKGNVMDYFQVPRTRRWVKLIIVVAATILTFGVLSLFVKQQ